MTDAIELRQVIDQLREELRFAVESVDVELRVGVSKGGTAGAKAKFWVLDLAGEAKYSADRSQTIRLKLKPQLKQSGGELLIGRDE